MKRNPSVEIKEKNIAKFRNGHYKIETIGNKKEDLFEIIEN